MFQKQIVTMGAQYNDHMQENGISTSSEQLGPVQIQDTKFEETDRNKILPYYVHSIILRILYSKECRDIPDSFF